MPLFSIITVNLNNANGLRKTIDSIANQNFTDYEHIIIDGASTDNSKEIINKCNHILSYWISEKDNGIYNAMNKGIEKASGDFCLFLNSGDSLVNEDVLRNVHPFATNDDVIYGDMQIMDKYGKITHGKMPDRITVAHMYKDTLWHPVAFIKRTLFQQFGNYNEHFKVASDYEFFMRILIEKKLSTIHIPVEITLFDNTGYSSKRETRSILMTERRQIQNLYINPFLLKIYRFYSFLRS